MSCWLSMEGILSFSGHQILFEQWAARAVDSCFTFLICRNDLWDDIMLKSTVLLGVISILLAGGESWMCSNVIPPSKGLSHVTFWILFILFMNFQTFSTFALKQMAYLLILVCNVKFSHFFIHVLFLSTHLCCELETPFKLLNSWQIVPGIIQLPICFRYFGHIQLSSKLN